MPHDLEHPEITCALRTGYPSWMQEDYGEDDSSDTDAYEAYCDRLYEEKREAMYGW